MAKKATGQAEVSRFEEIPEFAAPLSEVASVNESHFATYEDMIRFFSSSRGLKTPPPPPQFFNNGKGQINLYKTFSTASETYLQTRQKEQWNPLSQRPVTGKFKRNEGHLAAGFDDAGRLINAYIEIYHEMIHVMTWEPFFTGHFNPKETDEFFEFCSLSEGYAFFEADQVMTPTIRERFPDGEILYKTSHLSMPQFHPYRAFKAAGINKMDDILDVYLEAFCGKPNLFEKAKDNFSSEMCRRIASFYHTGAKPALPELHRILSIVGIFGDFYENFCAKKGLPSLFSDDINDVLKTGTMKSYYETLFKKAAAELAALDEETIDRVRQRRIIQTRAYYGYEFQKIVAYGWYAPHYDFAELPKIGEHVESYLEMLQGALEMLVEKKSIASISAAVEKADLHFEKNVRSFFEKNKLWSGERQEILPRKPAKNFSISLNPSKPKPAAYIQSVCAMLIWELTTRFLEQSRDTKKFPDPEPQAAELEKIDKDKIYNVIARLAKIGETIQIDPDNKECRVEFSEILQSPEVLPLWSIPIWKVNPAQNRFEELLFNYE